MGESRSHMRLVGALIQWIADNYLSGDLGSILSDSPDSSASAKPPKINNFVPDVYAMVGNEKQLIIGEAKTARDLENRHTCDQLTAFLLQCTQTEDSLFVFAVPWYMTRLARNIVHKIQNKVNANNVVVVVLEKLQG